MPTANEEILSRQIAHQTYLQRYSVGVVRQMISLLTQSERDVIDKLNLRLERILTTGKDTGPFTSARMLSLLDSLRDLRSDAYLSINKDISQELTSFARYERDFQVSILNDAIPVKLDIVSPSLEIVKSATLSRPFQGRLLKNWVKDLDAKEFSDIRRLIKYGIVEGETTPQIINRVRGKFKTSKAHVETIVRSAISHVAAGARDEVGQANAGVIKAVKWLSTLDGRTTLQHCVPRDNRLYTLDHKPQGHNLPWNGGPGRIHPRCRSAQTFITKSWKELGIDLKEAPPGTRASMNGQVPDDLSYGDWLKKQPRPFVEETLGRNRARLFLDGKLKIDKFSDRKGNLLTLDALKKKEAKSWKEAFTEFSPADNITNSKQAISYVVENGTRANVEFATAYLPGKKELLRKRGQAHSVSFNREEVAALSNNGGAVLVHNHPGGMTLSTADLRFADKARLKKIVAAGTREESLFEATVLDGKRLNRAITDTEDLLSKEIKPLFTSKLINASESVATQYHLLNTALDSVRIIRYQAVKLDNITKQGLSKIGSKRIKEILSTVKESLSD